MVWVIVEDVGVGVGGSGRDLCQQRKGEIYRRENTADVASGGSTDSQLSEVDENEVEEKESGIEGRGDGK